MRVSFDEMERELRRVFQACGMTPERAWICARVHTSATYDGVASHGINRVPRFVDYVRRGWVDVSAQPTLEKEMGAVRVYNGNLGPGVLNALFACDRAMELARQFGIGMVGLKNTTHWMRGGTYGLYAARRGYAAILWTNTEAVMPPWGSTQCRVGNNPFVLALPSPDGERPFLLDMALSQFSYGKLQTTRSRGERLPVPGGFDESGALTDDPAAIERTRRILPMGYWKGSALAFLLDILAAALTGGAATADLDAARQGSGGGCSQVIILIDPGQTTQAKDMADMLRRSVDFFQSGTPAPGGGRPHVPGAGCERFHADYDKNGILVDDAIWAEIQAL